MKNQCSPDINATSELTCFSFDQLKSIAKKYNTKNKNDKIVISRTKKDLWNSIQQKMKYSCDDEKCWADGDKSMMKRFRPDKPTEWDSNPRTWLTNFDIKDVMMQYEKKYKTFKFIGVFPNNYDDKLFMNVCVSEELCKLDITELITKGKYQLGIVFNTDPHWSSGAHWVAVYIGISEKYPKKFGFFYYDSNAENPSAYVSKLYKEVKTQMSKITQKKFDLYINNRRHQFKNTECGMFSMHFIINMLDRKREFKNIINDTICDDKVFKLRDLYYN
tara:strand:+ start:109 stop:933 length:825 start_codon:yes stop_codon:yes gene_type:complete